MTRRELALDSFWRAPMPPLVQHFIATTGRSSFSLKELIMFAEKLPDPLFLALQSGAAVRSDRPVSPRAKETIPNAQRQ